MSHREEGPKNFTLSATTVQALIKIGRDLAVFILGAIGFIHELLRSGTERPQILILSAAMMGLPLVLRGDEKRSEVKSRDKESETNHGPD